MKLGLIFSLAGLVCAAVSYSARTFGAKAILIYLAFNFLCLGFACIFRTPGVWMKRTDGCLHPLSYLLLAPLHCLNWIAFTTSVGLRKEPALHQVAPNVWLGRRIRAGESRLLPDINHLAVLDLTAEFAEAKTLRTQHYLCLPVLDHSAPTGTELKEAVKFIHTNHQARQVYVHCALGHGRSATVVAAWLLDNDHHLPVESAISRLRSVRKNVSLSPEQRRAVDFFADERESL